MSLSENYNEKIFIQFLKQENVYYDFKHELKLNGISNVINEVFEFYRIETYVKDIILNQIDLNIPFNYGEEERYGIVKKYFKWYVIHIKWLIHLILLDYNYSYVKTLFYCLKDIKNKFNRFYYIRGHKALVEELFDTIQDENKIDYYLPKNTNFELIKTLVKIDKNNEKYIPCYKKHKKKHNKKLKRYEKNTSYYRPTV